MTRFQARTSKTSASRKLEFLALLTPTMGVFALNQLVLAISLSSASSTVDLVGLQWYWIAENSDISLISPLHLGLLLGLTVSNLVTFCASSILLLSAVDVIHAVAMPTLGLSLIHI